ncbi:hypothetical protein [Teredinibacter haidensis]|uniref:hypothetical protein n=1 Tax=Teredinibacter haidensis TaxID=2731755 RepID=UPI000948A9FE|nr:hypothetical protein [Teredinibacter haidensis]
MIEAKVEKLFQESISKKRTSEFIKRAIFIVVERVLFKHYPETYSTRCLQSSIAISSLLSHYGIISKPFIGALCVSQVFKGSTPPGWNGFWGEDHHIWVCNNFGEFIDLTVKYLHVHPASKTYDQVPMPSIWWEETMHWPRTIKYLHQGVVAPKLSASETIDLEQFKADVMDEWFHLLKHSKEDEIIFPPILSNAITLNALHNQGDPWLVGSMYLEENNVPHPAWIVNREKELMKPYTQKT